MVYYLTVVKLIVQFAYIIGCIEFVLCKRAAKGSTPTVITHTATIIHMATTGHIRTTATIGHTTGTTDTVTIATIVIITTIGTKLT